MGRHRRTAARAALLLALSLLASGAFLTASAAASAVSGVSVSLGGNEVGQQVEYDVSFTTVSSLVPGQTITLNAQPDTVFPSSAQSYFINDNHGEYSVLSPPQLSNGGASVTLTLNSILNIDAGTAVTISIGQIDTGVTNPTVAGNYSVSVSTTNDTTAASSAPFTINAGPPSSLIVSSGDGQAATVASSFASLLRAEVTDQYGNEIAGQSVTFTAPASGASGTFAGGTTTDTERTDGLGVATSTTFTANTVAGTYQVQASAGSLQPASFSLTNAPGSATSLSISAGDAQTATVGAAFTAPLSATVTDQYGNGVPGESVTFAAPASGPSATFSNTTNSQTDSTDATGTVSENLTASTTPGTYQVRASATGLPPVDFALTNDPGPPAQLVLSAGSPQSVQIGQAFAPLEAEVTDQYGNPLAGQSVTFTAPAAGATGTFAGGSAIDTESTDGSGIATSTTFTANTVADVYQVQATSGALPPLNFDLANSAGPPSELLILNGSGQSTTVAQQFGRKLIAQVADQYGNESTTPGVSVTFSAPAGGAGATFPGGATTDTEQTNESGFVIGKALSANTRAGQYQVHASATGLTPVDFSLTNAPASASRLFIKSGSGQRTEVGHAFATPLAAQVTDQYGNPVSGQQVTFSAPTTGAGASFAGGSSTDTESTDSSGTATTPAPTANAVAGTYDVQANAATLPAATFALTNEATPAAKLKIALQPSTIVADGRSTTRATATMTDAGGHPLAGQTVTFKASGSQKVGRTTDNGDGTYTATITSTAGNGKFTITASTTSLTATATLTQIGSNTFSIRLASHDKATATLSVTVAGPGSITLAGKGVEPIRASVRGAATIKLTVVPTAGSAAKRRRHRQATVVVSVTYSPVGGTPSTHTIRIRLARA